jgi:hypothetical protein
MMPFQANLRDWDNEENTSPSPYTITLQEVSPKILRQELPIFYFDLLTELLVVHMTAHMREEQ